MHWIGWLTITVVVAGVFNGSTLSAQESSSSKLLRLARGYFTNDLNNAEVELLRRIPVGLGLSTRPIEPRTSKAVRERFPDNYTIRANRIEWLCKDPEAKALIHSNGIEIHRLNVSGNLNLQWVKLPFALKLTDCFFDGPIDLSYSQIEGLYLNGSTIRGFTAFGAQIDGPVLVRNLISIGAFTFIESKAARSFDSTGAVFSNPNGVAFQANHSTFGGNLTLNNTEVTGTVSLPGISVVGSMNLEGSRIKVPGGLALLVNGSVIKGSLWMHGTSVEGEFRLTSIQVGSDLHCNQARFIHPSGNALVANQSEIRGTVSLNGSKVEGNVLFVQSKAGNFVSESATFSSTNSVSLSLGGSSIGGMLSLDKADFKGYVNLSSVTAGGLILNSVTISNRGGLALTANRIELKGVFDARSSIIDGEVQVVNSTVGGDLTFENAFVSSGSSNALLGAKLRIGGSAYFQGFTAEGAVDLTGADIAGGYSCENAKFINPNGDSLSLSGSNVRSSIGLSDARFIGTLKLNGVVCGSSLSLKSSIAVGADETAVSLFGAEIKESLILNGSFQAHGRVFLGGTKVGQNVHANGAQLCFRNSEGLAIDASGMTIGGNLYLNQGFSAEGTVNFSRAKVGGDVLFDGSTLARPNAVALNGTYAEITGNLLMQGVHISSGEVQLFGAKVGNNILANGATFKNERGIALQLSQVSAGGAIELDGTRIHGALIISHMQAGNDFSVRGAIISADKSDSGGFVVYGANILGSMYFHGMRMRGPIDMIATHVGNNLEFDSARLESSSPAELLRMESVSVGGSLFFRDSFYANGTVAISFSDIRQHFEWHGIDQPDRARLNLWGTKVGTLSDEERSWPSPGNINLDEFAYKSIGWASPNDVSSRLKWLDLQTVGNSSSYENLANAFRTMGLESNAKKVLIRAKRNEASLLWRIFGSTVGYGHNPLGALWALLGFAAIGCWIFSKAFLSGNIVPIEALKENPHNPPSWSQNLPRFNAFIFSIESLVPLIKLDVKQYWVLKSGHWFYRGYSWFHSAAGWVFTTLLVAAITGIIRK